MCRSGTLAYFYELGISYSVSWRYIMMYVLQSAFLMRGKCRWQRPPDGEARWALLLIFIDGLSFIFEEMLSRINNPSSLIVSCFHLLGMAWYFGTRSASIRYSYWLISQILCLWHNSYAWLVLLRPRRPTWLRCQGAQYVAIAIKCFIITA